MTAVLNFKFPGKWMLKPQQGGRLDAKRRYVIVAKALDGIWLSPPPCLSTALHKHDQVARYHPVPWLR